MKIIFKKLSAILISLVCLTASFTGTVGASDYLLNGSITFDEHGYAVISRTGKYVFSSNSIYQVIHPDGSVGYRCEVDDVIRLDYEPTISQLHDILDERDIYDSLFWIDNDAPHVIYASRGQYEEYPKIKPWVEFVVDGIKHEVRDYKTDDVLFELNAIQDGTTYSYHASVQSGSNDRWFTSLDFFILRSDPDLVQTAIDESASYNCAVNGDIDFNDSVDLTDLSLLSLHLIGESSFNVLQHDVSDVTSDGEVDLSDLARLKQFISYRDVTLGDK